MSAIVTQFKLATAEPEIEQPPEPQALASLKRESRVRKALLFAVREPFFQFLFLGLLIWLAAEYVEARNERYTIHVGAAERQRLAISYLQQFNQAPTQEQLQVLTDNYIKQQIFVREGRALGLDTNDEIVDRRIAQKFEFIQQDLSVPDDPSPAAIRHWYDSHKLKYLTPPKVSFVQLYFSIDTDGENGARTRAEKALVALKGNNGTNMPALGDQFPGPTDVGALAPDEAVRVFGESEFTAKLFKLPPGHWSGPFRSGYGWHLVYVNHVAPPREPSFEEVRARVASDYRDEQRRILNAQAYEDLRKKYNIRYDGDR